MTVTYNFTSQTDKITAVFVPSRGNAQGYSIVWFALTGMAYVRTVSLSGMDTPFTSIGQPDFYVAPNARSLVTPFGTLKEIGNWNDNASTEPLPTQPYVAQMGFQDAISDYNGTFANANGSFQFMGLSGNIVAVSFLPGHLLIDPELIVTSSSPMVEDTIQRKTLDDGSVSWLFYYSGGQIHYMYSAGLPTQGTSGWISGGTAPVERSPGSAQTHLYNGFAIAHFGRTVDVLWTDSCNGSSCGSSPVSVMMAEGVVSDDVGDPHITWRSGTADIVVLVTSVQYLVAKGIQNYGVNLVGPVTATYSSTGQLVFSYVVYANGDAGDDLAMIDRVNCLDLFCNPNSPTQRNEINVFQQLGFNFNPLGGGATYIVPTPLQGSDGVAFAISTLSRHILVYTQWFGGAPAQGTPGYCYDDLTYDTNNFATNLPTDFGGDQQMAIATTSSQAELFVAQTGSKGTTKLLGAYTVSQAFASYQLTNILAPVCQIREDVTVETGLGVAVEPYTLTASTEWDGNSVDLFFQQAVYPVRGGYANIIQDAHIVPQASGVLDTPVWASGYVGSTVDLTTIDFSGHYVYGAFDWGSSPYRLYAFQSPVPTDFNAGPNDPWVQLPGAPSVDGVNPSSGVLTYSVPLISTPVRGGMLSLSFMYLEPGLYAGPTASPSILGSVATGRNPDYGNLLPSSSVAAAYVYLNLPSFDTADGLLHLDGRNTYDVVWNQPPASSTGIYWFNNTRGVRFNFEKYTYAGATYYKLWTGAGLAAQFNGRGDIMVLYFDSSQQNYLTFTYTSNLLTSISASSGQPAVTFNHDATDSIEIDSMTYEGGKTISFCRSGQSGCSTSYALKITGADGMVTGLTLDGSLRLTAVNMPTGGKVAYTYTQNVQWGTGNDADSLYTYPISSIVYYNESATSKIAGQVQFNYHYEGQSIVENDVKVANSAGVWQGETQYRFRSDQALTTVRTLDNSAQTLYSDMQTLFGSNLADLSGNGNLGTRNSIAAASGIVGQSQAFSGSSGSDATFSDTSGTISSATAITVSFWFKPAYTSYPLNSLKGLIFKGASTGYSQRNYEVSFQSNGTLSMGFCNASICVTPIGAKTITDTNWHHVVAMFDWTHHSFKDYIDGVIDLNFFNPAIVVTTTSALAVGEASTSSASARFFQGSIDELRVFTRALSSDEGASLYKVNAIQQGVAQDWWAYNAQPHVTDTFSGYALPGINPANGTSSSYIDDWGNTINTQDALGNSKFASFANTNHQNEFYIPANLTRTSSGTLFASGFDYGTEGLTLSSVSGKALGIASTDYAQFGRYAPAAELSSGGSSGGIALVASFPSPPSSTWIAVDFSATVNKTDANAYLTVALTSGGTKKAGVGLNAPGIGGTSLAYISSSGAWTASSASFAPGYWYHFSFIYTPSNGAYNVWTNGTLLFSGNIVTATSIDGLRIEEAQSSSYGAWIDDVRTTAGISIQITGIPTGGIAELVGADGAVIAVQESAGGTTAVGPSIPTITPYDQLTIGNARIVVYAPDGTPDYISPRADFGGGDVYAYHASSTIMASLAETRTGYDYYSTMLLNEPGDISGKPTSCYYGEGTLDITCSWTPSNGWTSWFWVPTGGSGTQSHGLGPTEDLASEWVTGFNSVSVPSNKEKYLVTYVYVPPGPDGSVFGPDGIAIGAESTSNNTFVAATWGSPFVPSTTQLNNPNGATALYNKFMGPTPAGGTTKKFIVKVSDLFCPASNPGCTPPTGNLGGFYYQIDAGLAFFDGTAIGGSDSGNVTVSGLPWGYTAAFRYHGNGTWVKGASGTSSGGNTQVPLYPTISAFPVALVMQVNDSLGVPAYQSAPKTIWGGDVFAWRAGLATSTQSAWYNYALVNSDTHSALLGYYAPAGDCTNALLCYDMESLVSQSWPTTFDGTAVASPQLLDLSGRGNVGTASIGALSDTLGAGGMALPLSARTDRISAPSGFLFPIAAFTLSFWLKPAVYPASSTQEFILGQQAGSNDGIYCYLQSTASAGILCNVRNTSGIYVSVNSTAANLAAGAWVHIALTFDGTTLEIYNDGVLKNSNALSGVPTLTGNFIIGNYEGAGAVNGAIDQFAIYNSAMSAAQVGGMYQSRLPNAQSTYSQANSMGLPNKVHAPLNGQFVEKTMTYDSAGLGIPLTLTFNGNTTYYGYSGLYGGAYQTQVQGLDGLVTYKGYDFFTGNLQTTLDPNCRATRYGYDVLNRLSQSAIYDVDPTTVLWLDMATTLTKDTMLNFEFKDISCTLIQSASSPVLSHLLLIGGAVAGPTPLSTNGQQFMSTYHTDISGSDPSLPETSGTRSISAWVRLTAYPSSAGYIFSYGTASNNQEFAFGVNSQGYLVVNEYGSGNSATASTSALTLNEWHHVAVTWGTSLYFYVDGAQVSPTSSMPTPNTIGVTFYVGRDITPGGYLDGALTDVRVFSVPLAVSDVARLVAGTYKLLATSGGAYDDSTFPSSTSSSGDSIPRTLYFNMGTLKTGQSAVLEDLSGNGNGGVEHYVGNFSSTYGNAKSFMTNATTKEFISVADAGGLNLGNSFTLSAWVWPTTLSNGIDYDIFQKISTVCSPTCITNGYILRIVGGASSNGQPEAEIWNNNYESSWTGGNGAWVNTGSWQHIVFTLSAGGVGQFYFNGAALATGQATSFATLPGNAAGSSLYIGSASGTSEFFIGYLDEPQIMSSALSASNVTALYNGYTSGPLPYDPTHMSRTYFDGLGRPVREVTMDLYGHVLTTAQSLGWNDQPLASYLTNGQYGTDTYNYAGLIEQANAPGNLFTVTNMPFYLARQVNTIDGDGHTSFTSADVLGRIVRSGIWNPVAGNFNYTLTAFNAVGKPTTVDVYAGATKVQGTSYFYYNGVGAPVLTIAPDGLTSTTTYDNDLRVSSITDGMGHVETFVYVAVGQNGAGAIQSAILKASAGGTAKFYVNYTYTSMGAIWTIANSTATITNSYDSLYRLSVESDAIGGVTLATGYTYDAAGRVVAISEPKYQGTIGYTYDTLGRTSGLRFNGSSAAVVNYDNYGRMVKLWYWQPGGANGGNTTEYLNYSYDAANRITWASVLGGTNLMQLHYAYDTANLIQSVGDNMFPGGTSSVKTSAFGYDANGRLVSASGYFSTAALGGTPSDNKQGYVNYSYNAVGNINQRQDSDLGACSGSCSHWNSGQTVTYNYAGTYNELTSTSGKIAENFGYNALGSMTSRNVTTPGNFVYDFQQQLVKVCSVSGCSSGNVYAYSYDGLGRRVKEIASGALSYTLYLAYVNGVLSYQYNATSSPKSTSIFGYLGSMIAFRKDSGSTSLHFYASDLSNNVRLVWSDPSGTVTAELKQRYKPFGLAATPLATPSSDPRFRYAEQSYSSPTKLYAMGVRSYAPDLGRFTSRDPVGGHGYAYAADNPLSFWDPSGRDAISDFFGWLGGIGNSIVQGFVGAGRTVSNAFVGGFAEGANFWTTTVPNWWNGLDPNWKTAIEFAGLTALVIVTGGLALPFLGLATGFGAAALSIAAVAGAVGLVSGAMYLGTSYIGSQAPSLSGFFAHMAEGAFFGAVGAVAGPFGEYAGNAADVLFGGSLGETTISLISEGSSLAIVGGAAAGVGYAEGERGMGLLEGVGLAMIGSYAGDELLPTPDYMPDLWDPTSGRFLSNGFAGEVMGDVGALFLQQAPSLLGSLERFSQRHASEMPY